jgi:hypothetical protein
MAAKCRAPSNPIAMWAEFSKDLKVSPRAAAKIEDGERPFTLDVLQQRRDVLSNVVIASALPEIFGILVVTVECEVGYFFEILRTQFHVRLPAKTKRLFLHRRSLDRLYCPAARIACAVSFPLASAASTVPISRLAYSASPEKNTAPPFSFRSAACAWCVLGVA